MNLYLVFVVSLLMTVTVSAAVRREYPRGCIYRNGQCHRECPVGTHSYTTGCSQKMPEPTCEEPNPVKEEGILCDYSACYCDPPTVRHRALDKCVPLDECPKKVSTKSEAESHA